MGWGLAARGLFTHNKETEPMFNSLEPDANDKPETGALPLPPSGANNRGTRPLTPEKVRHMLYGSRAAIVCAASPERRIAPSKSSMPSATPTPTMVATPSPCRLVQPWVTQPGRFDSAQRPEPRCQQRPEPRCQQRPEPRRQQRPEPRRQQRPEPRCQHRAESRCQHRAESRCGWQSPPKPC